MTVLHASNCADDKGINRPKIVEHIVAKCKRLVRTEKIKPREIAILSPTARSKSSSNFLLNTIRTALEYENVPAYFNQREYESPSGSSNTDKNRIYIGTCHSFKGAERDHVILLNFFIAPGAYMREFDGVVNRDFKNLLFVACTRAKETLELIESCYYPSKNERVDFIRKLESEMEVKNVNVQKLGKLVSSGSKQASCGVTENPTVPWTVPQSKALAGITAKSEVAREPEHRYKHPRVFTENADSAIYGKFIELVHRSQVGGEHPYVRGHLQADRNDAVVHHGSGVEGGLDGEFQDRSIQVRIQRDESSCVEEYRRKRER